MAGRLSAKSIMDKSEGVYCNKYDRLMLQVK